MVARRIVLCALIVTGLLIAFACTKDEPSSVQNPASEQKTQIKLERNPRPGDVDFGAQSVQPALSTGAASPPIHRAPADESTITPDHFRAELEHGQCAHLTKSVSLAGSSVKRGDILFVVDITGSMGGELNKLKSEMVAVANQLSTIVDDPAFGLVTHMDYPGSYNYCGYSDRYGNNLTGDYAYKMNVAIDPDVTKTNAAIQGLALGDGWDGPESYARVLYETYSDGTIGWRPGASRIVVYFGDAVPHDCDLGSCLGLSNGSTGIDPGRDGMQGTADDLRIMDVLNGMKANNTKLIFIYSGVGSLDLWNCWAEITSGTAVQINSDGSIPGGINLAQLIYNNIATINTHCGNLTLTTDPPAYAGWIQNLTPPAYTSVVRPATASFDLDICVPPDAVRGMHVFQICGSCDGGLVVCENDTIEVPDCNPATPFLIGYRTVSYAPPIWTVQVEMRNAGTGDATNVAAVMNEDIPWLTIPDPNCFYGNIPAGGTSWGDPDQYTFDLTGWPGGSFSVWFDVTYQDGCGRHEVRLDPEFMPGESGVVQVAPESMRRIVVQ